MHGLNHAGYTKIFLGAAILAFALICNSQESVYIKPQPLTAPVDPSVFEPNRGQTNRAVRFLSRGSRSTLFLTDSTATLQILTTHQVRDQRAVQQVQGTSLRMTFVGAHASLLDGEQRLSSESNYLVGPRSQWHTHVPQYARVRYRDLYPGIDVVFYGNQSNLEYDWIVSPGSDLSRMKMHFEGADRISVDSKGNVVLHTSVGRIEQKRPRAYQQRGNDRVEVPARYVVKGSEVRVAVGPYDRRKTLTIDPVLTYATYLGGSAEDSANAVAVDGNGNAYVAGTTYSPDFPVTPGTFTTSCASSSNSCTNAFVSKLNSGGTGLKYSTFFGSNGYYSGYGLAVDSSGDAFLVGNLVNATNFPGKVIGNLNQQIDTAFIAKLNPTGSGLVYALAWGGVQDVCSPFPAFGTSAYAVALDASGQAWVAGGTSDSDFPTTANAYQRVLGGGCNVNDTAQGDAFVSVINSSGSDLTYSTYIGGGGVDTAYAIALDSIGNAYITGDNDGGGYPTTPGAFMIKYPPAAYSAGFVTKFNISPTLGYSTYLAGSDQTSGVGIAVDQRGDAFVAGLTTTPDFPTTSGAFKRNFPSGADESYVSKLNPSGSGLIYSTFVADFGCTNFGCNGQVTAIAIDAGGHAFITGGTNDYNSDFPITPNAFQKVLRNRYGDAFLTELDPNGASLLLSSYLGGSESPQYNQDLAKAIAVDQNGQAYLVGEATSSNFPVTYHSYQAAYGGSGDAFAVKVSSTCSPQGTPPVVDFCTPLNGATVAQTFPVTIVSSDPTPVTQISLLVDGNLMYSQQLTSMHAVINLTPGTHTLEADAMDQNGSTIEKTISVTVE